MKAIIVSNLVVEDRSKSLPFKCPICDQYYLRKGNCVNHITKVHSSEEIQQYVDGVPVAGQLSDMEQMIIYAMGNRRDWALRNSDELGMEEGASVIIVEQDIRKKLGITRDVEQIYFSALGSLEVARNYIQMVGISDDDDASITLYTMTDAGIDAWKDIVTIRKSEQANARKIENEQLALIKKEMGLKAMDDATLKAEANKLGVNTDKYSHLSNVGLIRMNIINAIVRAEFSRR